MKALAAHAGAALAEADRHVGAADRARRTAEALAAIVPNGVEGDDEGSGEVFGRGGGGGVMGGSSPQEWNDGSELSMGLASGSRRGASPTPVSMIGSHQMIPSQAAQSPAIAGSLRSAGDFVTQARCYPSEPPPFIPQPLHIPFWVDLQHTYNSQTTSRSYTSGTLADRMDSIAAVLGGVVDVLGAVGSTGPTGSTGTAGPGVVSRSADIDVTNQVVVEDGLTGPVNLDDGDEVLLGLTQASLESSNR